MSHYVLHKPSPSPSSTLCPAPPITRDVLTVSGPELLNQEDTFTDDTFITINHRNLIKKVIPPLH